MEHLDRLNDYLCVLKGAELIKIGRCANMVWLLFQKDHNIQYSIHIQCPCRFTKSKTILLADGDIYYPLSNDSDWDVQGNNIFDKTSTEFLDRYRLRVYSCSVEEPSDLCISFQNNICFRVFCNNIGEEEQWRFFSKGSGEEHLVIRGNEIGFE